MRNVFFGNPPSNYLHAIKKKGEHLAVFKEYKTVHFCAHLYCFVQICKYKIYICKYKIYIQMKFEIVKYPNQTLIYFPSNHSLERLPGIAEDLSKMENAK